MEKFPNNGKVTFSDLTDLVGIPDEKAGKKALTAEELRNRLKYIAGLCYALSCDLQHVDVTVTQKPREVKLIKSRPKETFEQRERRLEAAKARVRRRKEAQKGEHGNDSDK